MKKLILFTGFSLGIVIASFSQNQAEIDSLIKVNKNLPENHEKAKNIRRLHELTMFTDPELARDYAEEAFEISKKIGDAKGIGTGYMQIGNYFINRSEDDSAAYYLNKALEKYKEINSIRGQIFANHSLADIQRARGNYDSAIAIVNQTIDLYENSDREKTDLGSFNLIGAEYLTLGAIYVDKGSYRLALQETLKSVRFFEEIDDPLRLADALKQVGDIEHTQGHYESSLKYQQRAFQIYKDFDDKVYQTYAANSAGLAAAALGDLDLAIDYQNQAIALAREMEVKTSLSAALKDLGSIYTEQGDYTKAKTVLNEALAIAREIDTKLDITNALSQLATVDMQTNAPAQALAKLNEVISIAEPIGANGTLSAAYAQRSQVFEMLNDQGAALADFKQFQTLNDSIYNTTKSQQIEELKTIYETEKKEQAIEALNQEVKISNLRKGIYAGGMFTFIAVSGLLWFGFSQRIKRNRIERVAREAMYQQELAFKKKELTSQTLHLVQKNLFLENLKENLEVVQQSPDAFHKESSRVLTSLKTEVALDQDWETFKSYFVEVHNDFDQKLIRVYPDITENELRLAYFLRMKLSTRELAAMLHVQPESIRKSRYRLKKKLDLGKEDDLYAFLAGL